MRRTMGRIAAIAVFLLAQASLVSAGEIKVFSTIGVQSALEELAPKFEKATGHKLNISWATAAILVKRVQAGESADLYVLTRQSSRCPYKRRQCHRRHGRRFRKLGHGCCREKGFAQAGHFYP